MRSFVELRAQSVRDNARFRKSFRCLTLPSHKTSVGLEVAFPSPRLRFPALSQPI
jgi:hypothetical protein